MSDFDDIGEIMKKLESKRAASEKMGPQMSLAQKQALLSLVYAYAQKKGLKEGDVMFKMTELYKSEIDGHFADFHNIRKARILATGNLYQRKFLGLVPDERTLKRSARLAESRLAKKAKTAPPPPSAPAPVVAPTPVVTKPNPAPPPPPPPAKKW